jgi:hypothetical protein
LLWRANSAAESFLCPSFLFVLLAAVHTDDRDAYRGAARLEYRSLYLLSD